MHLKDTGKKQMFRSANSNLNISDAFAANAMNARGIETRSAGSRTGEHLVIRSKAFALTRNY
jgi:hypothetical protein